MVIATSDSALTPYEMFAEPSKLAPLIVRAVASFVAVPAFPPTLRLEAVPVRPVPAPVNDVAETDPLTWSLSVALSVVVPSRKLPLVAKRAASVDPNTNTIGSVDPVPV